MCVCVPASPRACLGGACPKTPWCCDLVVFTAQVHPPSPFPAQATRLLALLPAGIAAPQPSAPGQLPATGAVIPAVGPWSEVASQLRRRREELAAGSAQLMNKPAAGPPAPGPQQAHDTLQLRPPLPTVHVPGFSCAQQGTPTAPSQPQQQPAAQARPHAGIGAPGQGVLAPGAVKPRGGARRSALGPMLNHLRNSGALCDGGQ